MPFFAAARPSIQIGLLHALVEASGFSARSFHFNLELAARLGSARYAALCNHRRNLTGEWLFARAAFGDAVPAEQEFFSAFPEEVLWAEREMNAGAEYLTTLRRQLLPAFILECAESEAWEQYDVIGFTSTFQQNVAALALAKLIKQRARGTRVVFGGANFESEMGPEYVRAFDCIDFAVVGEADVAFPELLRRLSTGEEPSEIEGVVSRNAAGHVLFAGQSRPVLDLNELPTPHYDDYFERARQHGLLEDGAHGWAMPFESSRGCWWGKKHHCTFCGLNGLGMGYRSKHASRVLKELEELAQRHRVTFFEATDNILDLKHIDELFGEIRGRKLDYQFFYEIKANLTREQVLKLQRGGVRWVQPGIESLSTRVLRLMRKGATMLQNVRLLKWCRYYRIRVSWNLLWGFPGETADDYEQELEVLRLIPHLEPPAGCGRVWLERFSPFFQNREQFGIHDVRAESSYAHAYPAGIDLEKIAYFFEYVADDTLPNEAHRATAEWVDTWRARWQAPNPPLLAYRRVGGAMFVDEQRGDRRGTQTLWGPVADAYEYCCETMRSSREVYEHLDGRFAVDEVKRALDALCEDGLMLKEDDTYLGLALPENPNYT
jgi:ribosomal peptide maturation radical SAM protein 1